MNLAARKNYETALNNQLVLMQQISRLDDIIEAAAAQSEETQGLVISRINRLVHDMTKEMDSLQQVVEVNK
ncbi:hypothetical protein [uncultured Pseudomonas sp.]|uniref:hypothetical protein n=1 Tax=uncultured Pseudomonas sp. TaxID=114707 RepID=UPI0030D7C15C